MTITHVRGRKPVTVPPEDNLTTRLWERASSDADRQVLRFPVGEEWQTYTWGQLADRVREIAAGLLGLGLEKGDRVALMSGTRVEWTLADLAILAAGGITVPIYETSSAEQCAWILGDSGAKFAIAEKADHAKTLDKARDQAGDVQEIFVSDDDGLQAIVERGSDADRDRVQSRAEEVTGDDVASFIYTSGTTGNPKGCILTHSNLVWTARQTTEGPMRELFSREDSTLLFLPLAHSFARIIQFGCLEGDVQLGYARSIETVQEDMARFEPTFLLSVPRVFEKVYNGAQRKAGGGLKGKIFDFASRTGQEWSQAQAEGRKGPSRKHGLADKLVYSKLREALGGRVRYCVSGGAPLAPHLAHFFHAAGITILEGYGLTETSAPATCNTPTAMKIGTVGQPLPGVEIKIADDGEILIKGGNVFGGYYRNDEATEEVLDDDGWFRSGDVGQFDDEGFLRITGRKKELIVTAAGKNVAPAVLEERLKAHRLVSQAMVVGDNRPFVAALITLDPDELAAFAQEHGLEGGAAELRNHEPIQQEIHQAVEAANEAVSRAESIRKVAVLERDFSAEDEEITPTMKVKRNVVAEHFADEIEQIYAS
jgi:long-chain acyl-CoA synthetase